MGIPKYRWLGALTLLSSVLVLAACGGSDDDGDSATTAAAPAASSVADTAAAATGATTAAAAGLPQIGGTLKVATLTGSLPYQSLDDDGKTVIGFEPELINEMAKRLGMTPEYTILDFDALLPGLTAGRFDLIAAGMIDKKEREDAADAINISNDNFTFAMKEDVGPTITSIDGFCGMKIGTLAGAAYLEPLEAAAAKCKADGKDELEIVTLDSDAAGFLALTGGQVAGWPSNTPLINGWVKDNPGYAPAGFTILPGPTAMYTQKDSKLTEPIRAAFQTMVDDGSYLEILKKWGSDADRDPDHRHQRRDRAAVEPAGVKPTGRTSR